MKFGKWQVGAMSRARAAVAAGLMVLGGGLASEAVASCTDARPWRGVNVAGAEFGADRIPGRVFYDYVYPSQATLDYFGAKGAAALRLPVLWERVQPALRGELASAEVDQVRKVVQDAARRGQCVVLDLHNYGRHGGMELGSVGGPGTADLLDVWKRLAGTLANENNLALGLMNEPYAVTVSAWAQTVRQVVQGLRTAGVRHWIVASGGMWSGVHSWFTVSNGTSNAAEFATLKDPLGRTAIEVHQYADIDFSGRGVDCISADRMTALMDAVSRWAASNGQKLLLGEFGVAPTTACLQTLAAQVKVASNSAVWKGWTYWAAGEWWGTYPFSIQPSNGVDKPQMSVLMKGWSR